MRVSIFVMPEHMFLIEFEFCNLFVKNLPFLIGILGACLAFLFNSIFKDFLFEFKLSSFGVFFYTFFNRKLFFDLIYNNYVLKNVFYIGYNISFKLIDKSILEIFGPVVFIRLLWDLLEARYRCRQELFIIMRFLFL